MTPTSDGNPDDELGTEFLCEESVCPLKMSFGPKPQRSPKSLLYLPKPCFVPVKPQVALVQGAFRSFGLQNLLHPLLTTFGTFLFSTRLPGALVGKD